jgi:hypothetical protein
MTALKISNAELAEWLGPASVTLDDDRLNALSGVVTQLASDIEEHELDAVRAAHGRLSHRARAWAAAALDEHAPTVKADDADALLSRLAAAAVIASLDESNSGLRCAFAVMSARFVGLSPLIEDLVERAADLLAQAGRDVRQREDLTSKLASAALGSLPRPRKPDEETGDSVDVDTLAEDVAKHANALRSVVGAIDHAFEALADRQASLDEEVEMLWWALRETSDSGEKFAALEPKEAAVRAAAEIADRTEMMPGPPSAGPLLTRVLGDAAAKEVAMEELVLAISEHGGALSAEADTLLPLLSAAAEHARLGTPDDAETWRTAAERTLNIDLKAKTSIGAGAVQVYRELLLDRLLTTD